MILTVPWLFTYFFQKDIRAFAFYPFVVVRNESLKTDARLLRHERIHLKQQLELLLIPFYIIYFTEFTLRWISGLNVDEAYRNISFEKEAFENDDDEQYLQHRKMWSMWRK